MKIKNIKMPSCKLMSKKEVCTILNIDISELYSYIEEKLIPSPYIFQDGSLVWKSDDIEKYINSLTTYAEYSDFWGDEFMKELCS